MVRRRLPESNETAKLPSSKHVVWLWLSLLCIPHLRLPHSVHAQWEGIGPGTNQTGCQTRNQASS